MIKYLQTRIGRWRKSSLKVCALHRPCRFQANPRTFRASVNLSQFWIDLFPNFSLRIVVKLSKGCQPLHCENCLIGFFFLVSKTWVGVCALSDKVRLHIEAPFCRGNPFTNSIFSQALVFFFSKSSIRTLSKCCW